jgi:hemerythrin superfamily protein
VNNYDSSGIREINQPAIQKATDVIRADHRKAERLFKQYESVEGRQSLKESLVRQICLELYAHTQSEEEVFYPAVQSVQKEASGQLVTEALREHRTIKDLIQHLKEMSPSDEMCDSAMQQLQECVAHHVEEEERDMLPQAETLLGEQLESLGARMQRRKQQFLESATELASAATAEQQTPQSA